MQLDFCPNCFSFTNAQICPSCNFDSSQTEDSPLVLKPGTMISGRYKIGRVLGIGGFGITYMGYDTQAGRIFAIKEYMPKDIVLRNPDGSLSLASSSDKEIYDKGLDMFRYETNILVDLSGSRGIVEAQNFVMENNTAYLIMEYLDGVSMKKYLNSQGTLDEDFSIKVLVEVAEALKSVHKKGLLHRDISPENIMILKDGTIKLIDFGAARFFVGERSRSLSLILKHGFAPVEQYSANGNQGEWTDIYALAATYYKLVTGITPPDALSRATSDTLQRADLLNPSISERVGKVIQKALAINYRDRYQNVEQFVAALRKDQRVNLQMEAIPGNQPEPRTGGTWWSRRKKNKENKAPFEPVYGGITTSVDSDDIIQGRDFYPPQPPLPPPVYQKTIPYVKIMNGSAVVGLWDLPENQTINVGRDSSLCGIVVLDASISRKHCSVKYDGTTNKFIVVDYSSNGTYFGNGERLMNQTAYAAESGTLIMLSSQNYIMEMGVR